MGQHLSVRNREPVITCRQISSLRYATIVISAAGDRFQQIVIQRDLILILPGLQVLLILFLE